MTDHLTNTHTHTHTHIDTHTNTHTDRHTQTHTQTHSIQTQTRTYTQFVINYVIMSVSKITRLKDGVLYSHLFSACFFFIVLGASSYSVIHVVYVESGQCF